jgi:ABC-type multidrug transport system ATPase subunit
VLRIENISFSYSSGLQILDRISFRVAAGQIVTLVGASGVGKSTLLKIIAGQIQASSGFVSLNDNILKGPNEKLIKGHDDIVMVSQSFNHDLYFSVKQNVENCLLNLQEDERSRFTSELISLLDLDKVKHQKTGTLSGGEQQRLSMACALAKEPQVLLLDEPFSHLDVHLRRKVGRYLRELVSLRKMTVLLVTHEGSEALSWSSIIYFIDKGRIKSKYSPESAYFTPKTKKEGAYFGELNSVVVNNTQLLFRPTEYSLNPDFIYKTHVKFKFSEFRGSYYANFFSLLNGKEVVLYNTNCLKQITCIYVGRE